MNDSVREIQPVPEVKGPKAGSVQWIAGVWPLLQPWFPLIVLAGMLLAAFAATPGKTAWLPGCAFHTLTGLQCPGCGSTRAFHALTHGDLLGALRMNALAVLALPLLAAGTFSHIRHARRGTPHHALFYSPRLAWTITVLVIAFGLLRNLPWWPLNLLAPR